MKKSETMEIYEHGKFLQTIQIISDTDQTYTDNSAIFFLTLSHFSFFFQPL